MIGMYTLNLCIISEFDPLDSLVIIILEFLRIFNIFGGFFFFLHLSYIMCISPQQSLSTHYCNTARFNSLERSVGAKLQVLSTSTLSSLSAWVWIWNVRCNGCVMGYNGLGFNHEDHPGSLNMNADAVHKRLNGTSDTEQFKPTAWISMTPIYQKAQHKLSR